MSDFESDLIVEIEENKDKHGLCNGAQEALAKVEEWVKENTTDWEYDRVIFADDLLHHLQQLKDNNKMA